MLRSLVFFVLTGVASAQVRGPVLGLVGDGASLRTMYGIAAAGAVGAPLDAGRELAKVEAAPERNFALATAARDGEVLVLLAGSTAAQATTLTGADANPDHIVFSPGGGSALLWSATGGRMQVASGLPNAARVRNVDASYLGGVFTTATVSDDGEWIAGIASGQAFVLSVQGQAIPLAVKGAPSTVAFFHGLAQVAVHTTLEVVLLRNLGGAVERDVIWSKAPDPPDAPAAADTQTAVGLAVSSDNARVIVTGNLGGVFTMDLTTGARNYVDCGCTPQGLFGLGGSLFRLTNLEGGALRVFDAATSEVWFVPLAAPPVEGGQQ